MGGFTIWLLMGTAGDGMGIPTLVGCLNNRVLEEKAVHRNRRTPAP